MVSNINSKTNGSSVKPINLRELFGPRYKVEYEDSYYAGRGQRARKDDPELQILLCHYGHIFLWGGQRLAASTNSRGAIAKKLAALDCCKVEQDGSDGLNVSFHIDDFRTVAKIIKPRGRRHLSPAQRQALMEAGKPHRLGKPTGQTTISEGDSPTPEV